ncbi:MAG: DUF5947 family protein [Isosphaeraceae bacterium]|nr:DUF5947 family protein [Isosphaeraceae bacterium]
MIPDNTRNAGPAPTALASIQRFLRPKAVREHCALCHVALADEHPHLVELATHRLACACDGCALLFDGPNAGRYRRIPRRIRALPDLRMSDEAWDALQLPINLAFFVQSTPAERVVALYPSPAGATESLVAASAWDALANENPVLRDFEPDVEGLLVNRIGDSRDYYRVGIDECYKLVGLIRTHWRGLSGGAMVWGEIAGFFEGLRERAHA